LAGDILLRLGHQRLERLALGGEPETVVDELGVFRNERIAQVHHLAIHRETLHLAVSGEEDTAPGSLVDPAALHPDKTVLDHVDAADPVAPAEAVEDTHDPV